MQRSKFPKLATIVIVVGLALVGMLFLVPGISIWSRSSSINTIEQANAEVTGYINQYYPDLKIDEIMEFSNQFYIATKENSTGIGALEFLVDRWSGSLYFEPGPNMMWNTKYGHMGRLSTPTAVMPILVSNATLLAQAWLDTAYPGSSVDDVRTYYGYYTMDFARNGTVIGMFSVNGYSGAIWYHSWHGTFVAEMHY